MEVTHVGRKLLFVIKNYLIKFTTFFTKCKSTLTINLLKHKCLHCFIRSKVCQKQCIVNHWIIWKNLLFLGETRQSYNL